MSSGSRLDRLFILLETGSPATRQAAAKQIGDVQKTCPQELHNLLNRLLAFLRHNAWDTRISAAQAIEYVIKNVPEWYPELTFVKEEEIDEKCNYSFTDEKMLSFDNFIIEDILKKGARLMGSEGSEFDYNDGKDLKEPTNIKLKCQRALLNEKLGLTQVSKLGINLTEMISDTDMLTEQSISNQNDTKYTIEELLNFKSSFDVGNGDQSNLSSGSSLSTREINRAKRKARLNRSNSNTSQSSLKGSEPEVKKNKTEPIIKNEIFYNLEGPVPTANGLWLMNGYKSWPFNEFCERLKSDIFNSKWEVRHGSATALRAICKHHIKGCGMKVGLSKEENVHLHTLWLEDMSLRLMYVLALDRFGDFVSDQVVAPVRETTAQVLGTIQVSIPDNKVNDTVKTLITFLKQEEWEVRHAGLLGLKYIFVVKENLLYLLLPLTVNDILHGLFDSVEDVGAVAAATLIPVAHWLPRLLNEDQVSKIVELLWNLLLNIDELSSASKDFMTLLATILSLPNASEWIKMDSMEVLLPRIWPFLAHNSKGVRRSTLTTIHALTVKKKPVSDNVNNGECTNFQINLGVSQWSPNLVQDALRHIYQRILIESNEDIQNLCISVWKNLIHNSDLSALLNAACPYVSSWICLAMQPPRMPFDPNTLISYFTKFGKKQADTAESNSFHQRLYLGGTESTPLDVREQNYMISRINSTRLIGELSHFIIQPAPGVVYYENIETPIDCYTKILLQYLNSKSSVQRSVCSLLISFWAENDPNIIPGPTNLQEKLKSCLVDYVYYDEVALSFSKHLQDYHDFIATLKQYKIPVNDINISKILNHNQIDEQMQEIQVTLSTPHLTNIKPKTLESLIERCKDLQLNFHQSNSEQIALSMLTQATVAGALVSLNSLPEKLNPVIKPLMESIKKEKCDILQKLSAKFLVRLLDYVRNRNPSPNNKIVKNLCLLLRCDEEFTPSLGNTVQDLNQVSSEINNPIYGIISLEKSKILQSKPNSSSNGVSSGSKAVMGEIRLNENVSKEESIIHRIGATYTILEACNSFKGELFMKLPILRKIIHENIDNVLKEAGDIKNLQSINLESNLNNELITSLQLIEILTPSVHDSLHKEIFNLLPKLVILIGHPYKSIRYLVARCFANIAFINHSVTINFVVKNVLCMIDIVENVILRQGAIETISKIVEKLNIMMVPYVVLFIVPLLGRMSDPDESVRLVSTNCFATLLQLMPLDHKVNCKELEIRKSKDKQFLNQLFFPKTIPDFKVPLEISANLRGYQQEGVNWLWFLNKYNLHGILCDDMGLGKTLQTICILIGDHYCRLENKAADLPSLVVCPTTLTGNWVNEVERFVPSKFLLPLHYVGSPANREKLRTNFTKYNLIITSYDVIRKDLSFFTEINWNYFVLDEGHVIKNANTKVSKAIKSLKANHRLILSGTPIQNNVLEIWSLFDFLMPGFLGTEKQFMQRFSRPILASRDTKCSSKDQEAGILAMESLHRQILPFLLRRIKDDVLTDLPPKITQDLLCELSPLQERLYEDFNKSNLKSEIQDCLEKFEAYENVQKKTHIFQALRYLQNVCNHPKLVLKETHPEYHKIQAELSEKKNNLNNIEHSTKLLALRQLLMDCGIGSDSEAVSQHRALIFCQLKAMIDIIEKDLLKVHLPNVTFLRLDGSIPGCNRQDIVDKFNKDPSIDCLLLTTQVGGLGLNLTGADTVIFVEHDWNPMKDLQAMDRAHRIGQKKVVNVYRLITMKSLEEKIMGLQKFKLITANTIVSSENSSMETMGSEQFLDLFNYNYKEKDRTNQRKSGNSVRTLIENLPELWSEDQYEEYDITQFISNL
ncbi:hypothetical protein ACFFRR_000969 [Megaselia abdita]